MGSWDEVCFVTKKSIRYGDLIVGIPVIRNPYNIHYGGFPDHNYIPLAPPVLGTYDSYGGISFLEGEEDFLKILYLEIKDVLPLVSRRQKENFKSTLAGTGQEETFYCFPQNSAIKPLFWCFMSAKAYGALMQMKSPFDLHALQEAARNHYGKISPLTEESFIFKGTDASHRGWSTFRNYFVLGEGCAIATALWPYLREDADQEMQNRLIAFLQIIYQCNFLNIRFDRALRHWDEYEDRKLEFEEFYHEK